MNVNVNKILVCSLKNEFHFAVGRGYGYLYTCYYRGKHSLVGLGYHSRSCILCSLSHKCSSGWLKGTSHEDYSWSGFVLPHTRRLQPNSTTNSTVLWPHLKTSNQDQSHLVHLVHKWHTRRLQTNSTVFLLKIAVKAETFDHCNKLKESKWFGVKVCDQCHKIKISNQWKIFQLKTTFKGCG